MSEYKCPKHDTGGGPCYCSNIRVQNEMDASINRDINPSEQCEWFEVETAIVGGHVKRQWCAHADNSGGVCCHAKCPVVEDINDE